MPFRVRCQRMAERGEAKSWMDAADTLRARRKPKPAKVAPPAAHSLRLPYADN